MAKGKLKSNKKGRGAISRFVDCFLSCCGRRRGRRSCKKNDGNNQLVLRQRASRGAAGDGFPVYGTQMEENWREYLANRINNSRHPLTWQNLCQDRRDIHGIVKSRDFDNIDGFIDARGDGVPQWLRDYRQFTLRSVDERVQDFCRIVSDFFQELGVPAHAVRTSIKCQDRHAVLQVMGAKRAFVFYQTPEGDIRLSLGAWDEDENGWHKRTYVETFWGLQLETEEFLPSPTSP